MISEKNMCLITDHYFSLVLFAGHLQIRSKINKWINKKISVFNANPRLPKLRTIFRPAETLKSTIKWLQLIVGSSIPVILAQKFYYPTLG